jgi:hypothetical protein
VRRALTWLAGAAGLAALARLRRRRRPVATGAAEQLGEQDPAEELRRKLADQRTDEPAGDDDADDPDPSVAPVDLEARRASVHTRAQAAIDLMRDSDTDPDGPHDSSVA